MADIVRLGIIGTGRMAQAFAADLAHADGIKAAAVVSRRQETADGFARRFGIPRPYGGIDGLLGDEAIDLIYVASPHAMHCRHTLMCLEAGKSVLCEKPFAINAAEARRMIDTARQRNLFLMEAMWTRCIPAVARLRELLAEGTIGRVNLMLAGGAFIPAFDPAFYLFRPELGGGVLLDAGVYLIAMASMVFGAPTAVRAVASIGDSGVDEHDAFLLQHADGAIASLYVSLRARSAPEFVLLGERGRIHAHPPLFAPRQLTLAVGDADQELIDLPFEGVGYQFVAKEAAACLRAGRTESRVMPLDESLRIMETMDEIRRQIDLTYPMEKT